MIILIAIALASLLAIAQNFKILEFVFSQTRAANCIRAISIIIIITIINIVAAVATCGPASYEEKLKKLQA